jgi:ubiquinone/menaquinone biosynthesis C-methylase UbiE
VKNKETIDYYDDFSDWYERERGHGYHAMLDSLELDIIRPFAESGEVLEVGVGTGLILEGLGAGPKKKVGIDISPGMLAKAKARGFDVIQGSATELPVEDERFDVVFSFKVLAHIPDIEKALSEMTRVLRPGGRLVAEFYNRRSVRYLAKRLGGPRHISENRTEAEVFTRWDTPEEVVAYLPAALTFKEWRGVRVITPMAAAFRLPLADHILPAVEKSLVSSQLACFGGFLVAVCEKN